MSWLSVYIKKIKFYSRGTQPSTLVIFIFLTIWFFNLYHKTITLVLFTSYLYIVCSPLLTLIYFLTIIPYHRVFRSVSEPQSSLVKKGLKVEPLKSDMNQISFSDTFLKRLENNLQKQIYVYIKSCNNNKKVYAYIYMYVIKISNSNR